MSHTWHTHEWVMSHTWHCVTFEYAKCLWRCVTEHVSLQMCHCRCVTEDVSPRTEEIERKNNYDCQNFAAGDVWHPQMRQRTRCDATSDVWHAEMRGRTRCDTPLDASEATCDSSSDTCVESHVFRHMCWVACQRLHATHLQTHVSLTSSDTCVTHIFSHWRTCALWRCRWMSPASHLKMCLIFTLMFSHMFFSDTGLEFFRDTSEHESQSQCHMLFSHTSSEDMSHLQMWHSTHSH